MVTTLLKSDDRATEGRKRGKEEGKEALIHSAYFKSTQKTHTELDRPFAFPG